MRITFQPCSGLIIQVTLLVCSIGLHLSCAASSSSIHYHAIAGWTRRKGSLDSFVSVAFAGWTRRKGRFAWSPGKPQWKMHHLHVLEAFRSVYTGRQYVCVLEAFRSVYMGRQYVRVLEAFRSAYTGRQYVRVLGAFRFVYTGRQYVRDMSWICHHVI